MDYIRTRVKELVEAGLSVDQSVVEKYLIHPSEPPAGLNEKPGLMDMDPLDVEIQVERSEDAPGKIRSVR